MSVARRSPHMNVMVDAVEKAGRLLLRDFGEVENLQVSRKGPNNFVTTADHKSEKLLRELLQKARPKYGFLLEESGEIKGEDASARWIVDPLDGTSNFMHGVPHWSVTVALEKDGEIIAGVIYDPVKDEMFTAEKGMGAFMNNRRLRVAGRMGVAEGLISLDAAELTPVYADMYARFNSEATLRRMGSACIDLAYVAMGRLDGAVLIKLNPWDCAAGALMVREAGGAVSDFSGGKDYIYGGALVAGNIPVHTEILKKIKLKQAS